MDEMLCKEKHINIEKELDLHNDRLNSHSSKIEELEKSDIGRSKDIERLCENLEGLNVQIGGLIGQNKWLIRGLIGLLAGFFFYVIEANVIK